MCCCLSEVVPSYRQLVVGGLFGYTRRMTSFAASMAHHTELSLDAPSNPPQLHVQGDAASSYIQHPVVSTAKLGRALLACGKARVQPRYGWLFMKRGLASLGLPLSCVVRPGGLTAGRQDTLMLVVSRAGLFKYLYVNTGRSTYSGHSNVLRCVGKSTWQTGTVYFVWEVRIYTSSRTRKQETSINNKYP